MSILIKDMNMPISCPCELIGNGYDMWCSFAAGIPARVKEYDECCQNGTRPSWCPLAPVPPHGRLIDIEPFMRGLYEEIQVGEITYTSQEIYDMMDNEIKSMPTIIEAEEGE